MRGVLVPSGAVTVAERQGLVAGYAAVTDGWLEHLYVDPAAQGGGIGSALFAHAQALQPRGFRFWVFQRNAPCPGVLRRATAAWRCSRRSTSGEDNAEREPDVCLRWAPPGLTPGSSARRRPPRRPGDLGGVLQRPGVEVGVADAVPVVGAGLGAAGHLLQLGEHLGVLVDAHHDDVAGVGARHAVAHRLDLVEHDLDLAAAHAALPHPAADALGDQLGGQPALAAAQPLVLAHDDDVEVLGGDRARARACRRRGGRRRWRSCRSARSCPGRSGPAFWAA